MFIGQTLLTRTEEGLVEVIVIELYQEHLIVEDKNKKKHKKMYHEVLPMPKDV